MGATVATRNIPNAVRFRVLERDGFRCVYCGVPASEAKLQIDHREPFSKGGLSVESNLVASCRKCNYAKRAKQLEDPPIFRLSLSDLQYRIDDVNYLVWSYREGRDEDTRDIVADALGCFGLLVTLVSELEDVGAALPRGEWGTVRDLRRHVMDCLWAGNIMGSINAASELAEAMRDFTCLLVPRYGLGIYAPPKEEG